MNSDKKTNLITPAGYQKLVDEVRKLWDVERPKVVEEVRQAALQGDRSENAEYIYGKRRLREIDRRLGFLQKRLDLARVINPAQQRGETVQFGATVTVKTEQEEEKVFIIVGEDEAEPKLKQISWKSPIGLALLNKRVGEYVDVETPNGHVGLTILKILFAAF